MGPLEMVSPRPAASSESGHSFAQQLATMLKQKIGDTNGQAVSESRLESRASSMEGRNSDGSQFSAGSLKPTPFTPVGNGGGSASTTPTAPASNIPTMLGMGPVAGTAPVAVPTTSKESSPAPEMTEGDAYWAAQPAAVQALRYMPEGPAKDALATSLTSQGYTIDTQIMVMGWDPQMTMAARAGYGYSWVPAWGQPAVTVQPGISDPYVSSNYDPANPPPGSIKVSTAFAIGTIQNPLVQTS